MADIFLSYAREDLTKAKMLAAALEKQGWSVFWDRQSIQIGHDLDEVIEEAIEQARCMIVSWSQVSKKSDWVRGEATIGRERRILLPVLFDVVSPPIAFRSLHTEDFSNWHGELDKPEFLNLCKAVKRLASNSQPSRKINLNLSQPLVNVSFITQETKETTRLPFEPEMVEIPAGSFQMGGTGDDEKPIHSVTFAKPFALGKYPVTFAEYDVFAGQTGRDKPFDKGWGRGNRPVILVSWKDACDYAAWLSQISGKAYRLPSEAEWEFACRAGNRSTFFWGEDCVLANEYVWYKNNSQGKTHPVGEKLDNPLGAYDMAGNVWEWVQDAWHDDYQFAPSDGSAWTIGNGTQRVLRGGSWLYDLNYLRSATRAKNDPAYCGRTVGFRLAQDLT